MGNVFNFSVQSPLAVGCYYKLGPVRLVLFEVSEDHLPARNYSNSTPVPSAFRVHLALVIVLVFVCLPFLEVSVWIKVPILGRFREHDSAFFFVCNFECWIIKHA